MQQAQQLGLTVLRVWAFNDGDGWQALQPKQGFLDVNALMYALLRLSDSSVTTSYHVT